MLLTISTTRSPATDLGYLLHKHPERLQSFDLPFGQAHVFYPEAGDERCTAALLLDVDPVGLIRRSVKFPRLDQYVNDRPYVASSFMSVALARIYVLIPVLDADKHYWVGEDEVEKLLRRGEGWLADHPARELIVARYLKHQRSLRDEALARLLEDETPDPDADQEQRAAEEE